MKHETMDVISIRNKKEQKELCNESKENSSIDLKAGHSQRSFGLLDMWNLQKRQRTSASMLRRLQ